MENMKWHWNDVYSSNESAKLGWYEKTPAKCLELVKKCNLNKNDAIIDIGCGTSSFIDNLLEMGFTNLIGIDISDAALGFIKERLKNRSSSVKLLAEDITNPIKVQNFREIALWHDRAVLHFLLTKKEQQAYLKTLKNVLRINGYAIIAAFNLSGAKKCSGLDVKNYDKKMLADFLGHGFKLKESFNHVHYTPSGSERQYVYTLFQRIK